MRRRNTSATTTSSSVKKELTDDNENDDKNKKPKGKNHVTKSSRAPLSKPSQVQGPRSNLKKSAQPTLLVLVVVER